MEPTINIGDIILVKESKELKTGDIISFRQGNSIITHRINEITEENGKKVYKTKGDNNNIEDRESVLIDNIEGKVIKIVPKVGKILIYCQNKIVILFIIITFLIYFNISEKRNRIKEKRSLKRLMYEKNKLLSKKNSEKVEKT